LLKGLAGELRVVPLRLIGDFFFLDSGTSSVRAGEGDYEARRSGRAFVDVGPGFERFSGPISLRGQYCFVALISVRGFTGKGPWSSLLGWWGVGRYNNGTWPGAVEFAIIPTVFHWCIWLS